MFKSRPLVAFSFLFLIAFNRCLFAQSTAAPEKGFFFSLKTNCTTSAGVFTSDGVLIRTLWSGEQFDAGDYTRFWDGLDDDGNKVVGSNYVFKILSNNMTAVWEGVIGNTTRGQTGFFDVIHSISCNDKFGYAAAGYEEQQPVAYKFSLVDNNNITPIGGKAATTRFVAADNAHVYWGASDDKRYWVYATNVSNDKPFIPARGVSVSVNSSPDCVGAIDVYHNQIGTSNPKAYISGLAVQQSGNYLFVSHGGINQVNVLNKISGALVKTIWVENPREIAVDDNDNLWMISATNTVAKYLVNADGSLSFPILTLSGVKEPIAIAARGNTVLVSDLNTQQVRSFNNLTGSPGPLLGKDGGYSTGPEVTNSKFYWKDKRYSNYGTFLAFQNDGSFWVGDGGQTNQHYGNCRYLHFAGDFTFKDRIMLIPAFYSCVVDKNNPNRAYANYLEFSVGYNQAAKDNWQLTNNWGYNVILSKDDLFTRLKGLQTLSNGRTYASVGGGIMDIVELLPGFGLRYTGVQHSINSQLYPDGSLYTMNESKPGQTSNWYKQTLTGFNASNNPVFSASAVVESTPVITNQDPIFTGNLTTLTSGEKTSSGIFVSFDGNTPGENDNLGNFKASVDPKYRGSGYHLGGVKNGKWMWKTALITHPEYTGPYPADGTFDIGNGVNQYSGSKALVQDNLIFWGYHGEFWKGGQTNMWNIVSDNGLFVNQFGTYAQGQAVDGMAGNSFSACVVKVGSNIYLYNNDESYHSGLHRWRIMGANTIEVQIGQAVPDSIPPDEGSDLMEGLPFNTRLENNTKGWTRYPEYDNVTDKYKQYWFVKTSAQTAQKRKGRDIFAKYRSDSGEATIYRDLGNNVGLTSWVINGKLSFDENNGNNTPDGGVFMDILDNTGKIIVRIGDERKYVNEANITRIIWGNDKQIVAVTENELLNVISKLQKLKIVENGGLVTIKYANYPPVTSTVFEPGANWQNPKNIRLYFFSKSSNYTRTICVSDLKFKRNSEKVTTIIAPDAQCPGTGTILREYWKNIPGAKVADIPINKSADDKSYLQSFRLPMNFGDNYAARVSGYVCVPKSGDYVFYLASDDDGELWLSTDANPANKKRIAYVVGYTDEEQYNKFPSQKSAAIPLKAGERYYIEALLKEATGGDHLSVAWRLPDGTMESPIPGSRLIPYSGSIVDVVPSVAIKTPADNEVLTKSSISFQTDVTDISRIVNKVEFYANSVKVGESTSAPYGFTWTDMTNGKYLLVAKIVTTKNDVITSQQVSVTVNAPPLVANSACPGSGSIKWEYWLNAPGSTVATIPLYRAPDGSAILTSFAIPSYFGEKYGSRIRGYVCVPQSGEYTFYIASDDEGELWLSTDANPANKKRIAYISGWSDPGQYTKFASQKSKSVYLKTGERYYIEALQKEESGGDHLSVAWTMPNGVMEAPIPGSKLIPYDGVAVPDIYIKAPANNSVIAANTVLIEPNVVDISSVVSKVEFYSGTVKIGESNMAPYSFKWMNVNTGGYSITAKIVTNKGEIIKSQSVLITVTAPTTAVPITVTDPPKEVISSTCQGTGSIVWEYWSDVAGSSVSQIPFNRTADGTRVLTSFASQLYFSENYGSRVRGYICVPQSGEYIFYIATDDDGELWLSTNADPANKQKIAYVSGWTEPGQYNKFGSQTSKAIYLQAGQKYYIEALQKEANGGDHMSVAWRLPNGTTEAPIPGSRLISYDVPEVSPTIAITSPAANGVLASNSITIETMVTNGTSTISRVEFYSGASKLGEALSYPYSFVWNNVNNGSYTLSAKLINSKGETFVSKNVQISVNVAACQGVGSVKWEYWLNVAGSSVADIPTKRSPDGLATLTSFATPLYFSEKYGSRVRGYLCVPQSGDYVFYIATDDDGELWLSTNSDPSNKQKIAYVSGWTEPNQYNKFASQTSKPIYLQAGQKYYIEALQKEEAGGDHLSVAWRMPNGVLEAPIPGIRLSAFEEQLVTPTISIKSPTGNSIITTNSLTITTKITDVSNVISKVEFYSGNLKIGESAATPYSLEWSNISNGSYTILAKAITKSGEIITSEKVNISVNVDQCAGKGNLSWEYWNNVAGSSVAQIPLDRSPDGTKVLTSFATPVNFGNEYASRVRGYICVQRSGNYIFYIATDDNGELWLSNDENPANKQKIAFVGGWTDPGQYDKYPSQTSRSIYLNAGQRYYIEALQKEEIGGDHLSVGWTMPDGKTEAPIPGTVLVPYQPATVYQNRSSQTQAPSSAAPKSDQKENYTVNELSVKAYPNPFVSALNVECGIPEAGHYMLQIFNVQGMLLQTIFNGELKPGIAKFTFNGSKLQSGVYVCRLVSGQKIINQQVSLIK